MNYKTIVLPVVGALVLLYQSLTHHVVSSETQDFIVNIGVAVVSFGVTLYGIFKSHKKG
jgi:hypothetical protein